MSKRSSDGSAPPRKVRKGESKKKKAAVDLNVTFRQTQTRKYREGDRWLTDSIRQKE
eukprot:gene23454-9706_t